MKKIVLFFVMLVPVFSLNAQAAAYVDTVYSCGNDVGIKISGNVWLVARQADSNEKRVDRMMSLAMTMLTAGKPIGYYNNLGTLKWCGIGNVRRISVLQMAK